MVELVKAGPGKAYGHIFDRLEVWVGAHNVRMSIATRDAWRNLNRLTQNFVVNYLWENLAKRTSAPVEVDVDAGAAFAIRWTKNESLRFDNQGFRAPWGPAPAKGTLVSGPAAKSKQPPPPVRRLARR